jgi:ubiquinone/menaquinone biosynthesis C-methylase UbiE
MTSEILSDEVINMAPCLTSGPYAENAMALVEAAESLGNARWADMLRAYCAPYFFQGLENIIQSKEDPIPQYKKLIDDLKEYLLSVKDSSFSNILAIAQHSNKITESVYSDVEDHTGNHYGSLFKEFSEDEFWAEPKKLLQDRLERNNVDLSGLKNKTVLDDGCGGGRYSVAWKLLGAKEVVGVDLSDIGIENANLRVKQSRIEGVSFVKGNVLDLPFEDNSFDIVYSNGVLHHTQDWKKGVHEHVRVLKKGGLGWQYLIENPGGIFWDNVEICRIILRKVEKSFARSVLKTLGLPSSRIFYMLDHIMVPINDRLTPEEIEDEYKKAGAVNIKRLERGTDFDRVERIYQKDPFATVIYGVGENRYTFSK